MARIDSFLRLVVEQGASDLHLGAGAPPTVRLNGELVPLPFRALSDLEARRLILEILTDAQRETVETEKDLDVVYDVDQKGRFRGNVFFHKQGIGSVFRVIPRKIPTLEELNLPPAVKNFTRLEVKAVGTDSTASPDLAVKFEVFLNDDGVNAKQTVVVNPGETKAFAVDLPPNVFAVKLRTSFTTPAGKPCRSGNAVWGSPYVIAAGR